MVPIFPSPLFFKIARTASIGDTIANPEGFFALSLMNPLWFAPNNGVLLYAPILLIALYGSVKYRKENRHLLWFLVLFLLISVVYGAWWSPSLGCGFGHRGFIEFFVFFSLPMSRVIRHWTEKKQRVAWAIGLVVATILFSAQWSFDGCWYGEGPWDWAELAGLITS